MSDEAFKECCICGAKKEANVNNFFKKGAGFRSACKVCEVIRNKEYYERKYEKKCREKGVKRKRKIRAINVETDGKIFRKCNECGKNKELNKENFLFSGGYFDTVCRKCKWSVVKRNKEERTGIIIKSRNAIVIRDDKKYKKCNDCGEERELSDEFFYKNDSKIGYHSLCKICVRKRASEYKKENKEKVLESKRKSYIKNRSHILEYMLGYNKMDYVKEKSRERSRKERKETPDKVKERQRRYIEKHYDELRAKARVKSRKAYAKDIDNKRKRGRERARTPKVRAAIRRYYHKVLKFKPEYVINNCVHASIFKYLNGHRGSGRIFEILGYAIDDLKRHLESLFEPWMNWLNHGRYMVKSWDDNDPSTWTWQIDHIIPQSDLLYDSMEHPNFKKCWALENLRPLSAKQNLMDGVTRARHTRKFAA